MKLRKEIDELLKLPGNGDLKAIKRTIPRGHNAGDEYDIVCNNCGVAVWLRCISHEGARFDFMFGKLSNGKMELIDTETALCCDCPDKEYALPDDFEVEW